MQEERAFQIGAAGSPRKRRPRYPPPIRQARRRLRSRTEPERARRAAALARYRPRAAPSIERRRERAARSALPADAVPARRSISRPPPPPNGARPAPRNAAAGGGALATLPPSQTPRDEYDLAYGYVLRKDYALAEDSLPQLLEQVSRAIGWRAKRPLARRKPVPAPALSRRRRSLPQRLDQISKPPPRRPDALLRLGQSLAALGREGSGLRVARRSHAQISARIGGREAGGRAGTEACPLLRLRRRSRAAEAKALFAPLCASARSRSRRVRRSRFDGAAACWRRAGAERCKAGPKLLAVTVDHGLRPESAGEARAVKRLARRLGVAHRTLRWRGKKPATGLQQAAREARYRLLAASRARARGRDRILTAHTLDDQAETVLIRMSRGSGLTGLGAMARESGSAGADGRSCWCVRCSHSEGAAHRDACARKIELVDDPSNLDPRFTRARLRDLMPALAREGFDARPPRAKWRSGYGVRTPRSRRRSTTRMRRLSEGARSRSYRLRCGKVRRPACRSGAATPRPGYHRGGQLNGRSSSVSSKASIRRSPGAPNQAFDFAALGRRDGHFDRFKARSRSAPARAGRPALTEADRQAPRAGAGRGRIGSEKSSRLPLAGAPLGT